MIFNTELVTRMIQNKAAEVPELGKDNVLLVTPSAKARFPCCVISPPLQREVYHGGGWDLSVTAEVWAGKPYEAIRIFDLVKARLLDYNFTLTGNVPLQQDIMTQKWRFGGYLDARWNAVNNSFEKNR